MARAKRSFLDYIGVTLAGAYAQKDKLRSYMEFSEPEAGMFTAIGCNRKVGLKEAVFLNGLNGHALDFDDGTNAGIIHLGSPILSVLLPLAQKYHCSFDKFIKSAVLGYETAFTMAVSIQPVHKSLGYHATGTCGVLGVAVAVSYLLDFSDEERKEAFAAACVSATGMLKVLDDGSELKPYNVAKSALMGLIATQMAKAGFKGHPDSLSGERGFLKMMTGQDNTELKEPLLNGTYAIEKTYTKPYAACRYCHPSIEAAISLRNNENVSAENVESIDIKTYYWAVNKHDHTDIPSSASAKMSIPYSVAVGIIYGKAGFPEYGTDVMENPKVIKLTEKVKVVSDDELTELFPGLTTAIVNIKTLDGTEHICRVDHPKGEPENPMTEEEFSSRFKELAAYGQVKPDDIKSIYDFVAHANDDWDALLGLLR